MKRFALALLPALIFLTACGKSPGSTVSEFYRLMASRDFSAAKEISTGSTIMLLEWMEKMPAEQMRVPEDLKILRDSIEGDRAWVFVQEKPGEPEKVLTLAKVDGKWKIDAKMQK